MNVPSGYTALDLIGFTDKGAYNSATSYVKNDLVRYNGDTWRCKLDDTVNHTPEEGTYWTIFIDAPSALDDLTDVTISSVANGDILEYDSATSKWKNSTGLSDVKQALTDLTNYDANTGVKNLLPVLLESGTLAGLTFTKDSDSLIANGTSTGDPLSVSLFTKNATAEAGTIVGNKFTLEELGIDKSKSYIFTCENNSNFKLRIFRFNNSTLLSSVTLDAGASSLVVTFPTNCDRIGLALVVINGTTLTNARIKPMLRLETISDSTYQPYAKPNTELTKDTKGLTENEFSNGCVNLFENKASSATDSSFTMIVNNDKSVTANGSGSIYFILNTYTQDEFNAKFAGKRLKISGTPESLLSNDIRIYAEIVSSGTRLIDEYNSPIYTMPTVSGSVRFYIKINGTVTNAVFKPMITVADMPNSDYAHYVQYAKSNKELTEEQYVSTTDSLPTNNNFTGTDQITIPEDGLYYLGLQNNVANSGSALLIRLGTNEYTAIASHRTAGNAYEKAEAIIPLKKGTVVKYFCNNAELSCQSQYYKFVY